MFGVASKVFRRFEVRNIHEFGYRRVTQDEHVSQGPDTVRARRPCRPNLGGRDWTRGKDESQRIVFLLT